MCYCALNILRFLSYSINLSLKTIRLQTFDCFYFLRKPKYFIVHQENETHMLLFYLNVFDFPIVSKAFIILAGSIPSYKGNKSKAASKSLPHMHIHLYSKDLFLSPSLLLHQQVRGV